MVPQPFYLLIVELVDLPTDGSTTILPGGDSCSHGWFFSLPTREPASLLCAVVSNFATKRANSLCEKPSSCPPTGQNSFALFIRVKFQFFDRK